MQKERPDPQKLDPQELSAQACFDLGRQKQAQGQLEAAAQHYRRALEVDAKLWPARYEYGVVCFGLGRLEEAITHVKQATRLEPRFALAHAALGSFLGMAGRHAEALISLQRAVDLDAESAENHYNLGKAHQQLNALSAAEDAYRQALRLDPHMALAQLNLGKVLNEQSQLSEGLALYRSATSQLKDPHLVSSWPMLLNFVDAVSDAEVHAAHVQYDQRWLRPLMPAPAHRGLRRPGLPERKLRLAYLSRDLRQHSMRYFLLPILRNHNRSQFDVTTYCDNADHDAVTAEYQAFSDRWVNSAGLSDVALAQRIAADGIDILFDLAGHTAQHRLQVFARQPAPVQVTYLGYPATTGASAIDWRISDRHIDPRQGEGPVMATSERPLRLNKGYFCYEPMADSPAVAPCPFETRGHITFGSLNQGSKLTASLLSAWAELLQALPTAKLCLQNAALRELRAQERMRAAFKTLGVDPQRLEFRPFAPAPAYLRSYHDIDIALDSYPYNGGTTTCEALWMGVPVVSWAGTRHVGRLGASILHTLGLQDLVADSAHTYVLTALALAAAPQRLRQLRAGLREHMGQSSLMDHAGFTAEMEAALLQIWREGMAPAKSA